MNDDTLEGVRITFKRNPEDAKGKGYNIIGKTGTIKSDLGYGIVKVRIDGIPELIRADIYKDTKEITKNVRTA